MASSVIWYRELNCGSLEEYQELLRVEPSSRPVLNGFYIRKSWFSNTEKRVNSARKEYISFLH